MGLGEAYPERMMPRRKLEATFNPMTSCDAMSDYPYPFSSLCSELPDYSALRTARSK